MAYSYYTLSNRIWYNILKWWTEKPTGNDVTAPTSLTVVLAQIEKPAAKLWLAWLQEYPATGAVSRLTILSNRDYLNLKLQEPDYAQHTPQCSDSDGNGDSDCNPKALTGYQGGTATTAVIAATPVSGISHEESAQGGSDNGGDSLDGRLRQVIRQLDADLSEKLLSGRVCGDTLVLTLEKGDATEPDYDFSGWLNRVRGFPLTRPVRKIEVQYPVERAAKVAHHLALAIALPPLLVLPAQQAVQTSAVQKQPEPAQAVTVQAELTAQGAKQPEQVELKELAGLKAKRDEAASRFNFHQAHAYPGNDGWLLLELMLVGCNATKDFSRHFLLKMLLLRKLSSGNSFSNKDSCKIVQKSAAKPIGNIRFSNTIGI